MLANAKDPFTKPFLQQIQDAGPAMSLAVRRWLVSGTEEFEEAFADMVKWRANALIVQPSLPRDGAIRLAIQYRLPTVAATRVFPEAGGLMSYAASNAPIYAEVATYVDRIVKGAKPADLPVQQPTVFELVLNVKTAKAIGVTFPRALLLRADAMIE